VQYLTWRRQGGKGFVKVWLAGPWEEVSAHRCKAASLREVHVVRDADATVGDLDPVEGVLFTFAGAPTP
jgi:hypothetical protein